jgi:hypothetical protein
MHHRHEPAPKVDVAHLRVTTHTIPMCACGQDLDRVTGGHCPRCGNWLRAWCDR